MNPLRSKTIQLIASLALILAFIVPAQAATVTPARFLPGDDAIQAASHDQVAPNVSFASLSSLVVWADKRSNPTGFFYYEFESSSDIYGMRLDADGNPLDATPIPIATGKASQENPQVVWNGSNWLVVFESYTINGTGFYYEKSLDAVRVSPAGAVLDPQPIRLYNIEPFNGSWAVASDGNNWVVGFEGTAAGIDLMALRISPEGVVLDPPNRILVKQTYYERYNLRLAYASGVFLLTWTDMYDTQGIRFDQNINLLDATPLLLVTGFPLQDLSSNGSGFYIVWHGTLPNFTTGVKGSRVSTAGVVLDGSGVVISGSNTPDPYAPSSVVWDGTNWKVTWENLGVRVASVSPDGQVINPGGVLVPGLKNGPTAPLPNGGLQVVWANIIPAQATSSDIFSAFISAANSAGPVFTISVGAPAQILSDAAAGSSGYMLVFRSDISGSNRIMAQPLDLAGNPMTAAPLQLDSGDSSLPGYVAVAWNGSLYLVVWNNSTGIVSQRIQQDGTPVDAAPFFVMPGFGPVDTAAVGDTFLAVGLNFGFNTQIVNPIAARVRGSDGVVLDATPLILGISFARYPAVTAFDGKWMAAWQRNFTHDDTNAETRAAFIFPDGAHDPEFLVYGTYSTGVYTYGPAVASSGTAALLVQNKNLGLGLLTDMVATLVNADGTLQPSFTLAAYQGNQYRPRVAWDGSQFVVVYQDQRNFFADLQLDQLDARSDLFGIRVSAGGAIIDPQGFVFSNSPDAEAWPNITAASGVSLVTGSILRAAAPFAAYRIGYEQFGAGGNAWPVAVASGTPGGGDVPLAVSFSSNGSADLDGSIAAYSWDFGDGGSSSEANPTHTYTTGGPFVATLAVTDNQGASTTNTVLVKATLPNQLPVAVAQADPPSGPAPLAVVFYASGSYDPDGSIGNFHWLFDDGWDYWGATAYHTFDTNGTHSATLEVFDDRGGVGTTTIFVEVGQANQPPVAVASADPTSGAAPLTVNFSSAGSTDPDGTIVAYFWNFRDGSTSTEANPVHVFTTPGTYSVGLRVTDNLGATDVAQVTITVNPGGGCTASCLRSTAIALQARGTTSITVSGRVTVKDELGATVSGATVAITWTLPDGSSVTQSAPTNNRGLVTFRITSTTGTYTLTVTGITKTGYTFDPANSILSKSITR